MNPSQLSRIVLKGFKSIRACDLTLNDINVLIGSNGSGKSNFISFFKLIQQMLDSKLQLYVSKQGGPDALLYFGRKKTERISAELYFGNNGYKFILEPTQDNRIMFALEAFWWKNMGRDWDIGEGHFETAVETQKDRTDIYQFVVPVMRNWRVYHFHDTSETALVKQPQGINDNAYLRHDARNLAAFLYFLKEHFLSYYERIVKTIRLIAPFFGDFNLKAQLGNKDQIELEWTEKGDDIPFKAYHLSDGTLRFICLTTVLLQPEKYKPEIILIDEPELGLHPYAIKALASLLKFAAKSKQVIISTQSVELLNEFEPEDIIVADRTKGYTNLNRLDSEALLSWLEEYSLGELWQKNILGGRPSK
jgi:predicted ATPase